jgi:thermitase
MNRIVVGIFVACGLLSVRTHSFAQAALVPNFLATRRTHPGGPDPLAAPRRVRAYLLQHGLPPMGPVRRKLLPVFLPRIVAGQYIVKFRSGAAMRMTSARRVTPLQIISSVPKLRLQTVSLRRPQDAEAYRKDPNVEWIEPNAMRYPLMTDPNDPAYNGLDTQLPSDPSDATWYKWDAHLIQCVDGWSVWPGHYFLANGKGAGAVKIAIVDTGVDYNHPDFANAGSASTSVPNGQLYQSLDKTMFNGGTTAGAPDAFGHGTHVTGIAAAATNNGIGVTGNGYNSNVISIRVTDANGNGTSSDLARAIVYAADSGAVVCNVSLGDYTYSQAEQDAVNYAWNKGMLVVAAAGNDGETNPPPYIYPASLSRVLGVSATSREEALASYSSWGDDVGICAPGGDFDYTIMWFLGVYSTTPTYTVTLNGPDYGMANNYDYLEGTSMASPQVTGLAALYAGMRGYTQATPGAPLDIWRAIQRGADGDGGWSPYFGFGRINVYNTMNVASVPNPRGDTVGCITGQVRYKSTVVLNANVQAVPIGGGSAFSTSSRGDGGFRIANLPSGTYNVTATYFGESQTLSNVTVIDGCDTPGNDFNVGAAPPPPPPAPTNLVATAGSAQASLTWSASTGATSYNVKRATVTGGPYTQVTNVTATSYTNTGLTNGTKYYFVVTALNANGESGNSNEANATPTAPGGATAVFLNLDTTTHGTWKGVYGGEGYAIAQLAGGTSLPAYAQWTVIGNSNYTWNASTTDVRALQKVATSDRIAACWYGLTFTGSLNLTDGQAHQVALYFLDWDTNTRGATVDILDGTSNTILSSQAISSFNGGKWLVWSIQGNVKVRVTRTSGTNATLSGIFFGGATGPPPPPPAPTNLVATAGNAQVSLTWGASTGATSYNVKRSTTTGGPYTTIKTGQTSASYTDTGVTNGTKYYYVVTAVNGNGESGNSNEANATPSAPSGTTAVFLNLDTTTHGTWKGVYGSEGYTIAQLAGGTSLPAYAQWSVIGNSNWTWNASTTDVRALQKVATSDRIAACWYGTTFTASLNLTDGQAHQVTLYFLDWDTNTRAETVDVLDAATNTVLSSQTVSSYNGGKWLVWSVSGNVKFRITRTGGANSTLSGVFFK